MDIEAKTSLLWQSRVVEEHDPFSMLYEERTVRMPNDLSLALQTAKSLVDGALPREEKNRYHLILGLGEIINNAIEHGNLGIGREEKRAALAASNFYSLAISRANREPYKSRVVSARSRVFPAERRVEFTVADQGDGFDWRALPDPREDILSRSGRGVLIARFAYDEVKYNEAGNEVVLTVRLGPTLRRKKD